jgi:hypothetical protein
MTLTVLPDNPPWYIGYPKNGSNVVADLSENVLTISGTGYMTDFGDSSGDQAPWWYNSKYREIIKNVVIESGVTNIGSCAFKDCFNLQTVTIEDGETDLSVGDGAFDGSNNIQTVHLGRNLISDTYTPFEGKKNLETLILGSCITEIGDFFFSGCSSLSQITSYAQNPPTIQSNTFMGVSKCIPVMVPSCSVSAYKKAEFWCRFANIQKMGDEGKSNHKK